MEDKKQFPVIEKEKKLFVVWDIYKESFTEFVKRISAFDRLCVFSDIADYQKEYNFTFNVEDYTYNGEVL